MDARRTVKNILIAAVAVAVIAGTYIATMRNIHRFEHRIIAQTQGHLLKVARSKAESIEAYVRDIQEDLQMLAQDPRTQQAILNSEVLEDTLSRYGHSPTEVVYNHISHVISTISMSGTVVSCMMVINSNTS